MTRKELLEKIESIENKLSAIDKKMTEFVAGFSNKKTLVQELDLYRTLGLNVDEINLLLDYSNISALKEEDIKRLMKLNDLLTEQNKWIDLINDSIIHKYGQDWKVISKNQVFYILNKKKFNQEKQNVVINVYLDNDKNNKFNLKNITKNGDNNE